MLTCKQVSNALAQDDHKKLPVMRRFFLRLHVLICPFCGKFNTQVIDSQDMCREFKAHEDVLAIHRPKMDPDQKESLKQALARGSEDVKKESSSGQPGVSEDKRDGAS